ncbi:R3H domain-containing protein 4 isoform X2 [Manihot esculenta]|uniref:R3H domain-containing protein 4 isoform X2 n=1 Tax=Manihot esculenta TaxID=3983 RepID=UPI001CC5D1EF|nr:R3H domain-containing protein 4 isoform X2 [Manihot esculenta]XP_043812575.1 R3H domain-containing protein 4 isoform X2 [Manihot esculenta]
MRKKLEACLLHHLGVIISKPKWRNFQLVSSSGYIVLGARLIKQSKELFGDDVPPSPFSMTNVGEWEKFRNIDMDKEAHIIDSLNSSSTKRRGHVDANKLAVLKAWRRIDCRTREALRRSFLTDLIEGYEACIRAFIQESGDEDVLALQVQDPFHRLLLHGVCEFYNLVSVTVSETKDTDSLKTTRIKKKKMGVVDVPNITLSHFLKMSKEGVW